jgi:hypothetical protein
VEKPREWPDDAPGLKARFVTLIARVGDELVWATTAGGKRELLSSTDGPLWAVWTGTHASHLFVLSREQARLELELNV